jgi:DNA repair ATPase RecN
MSAQQFTEFMQAQVEAIETSGLEPDEWVELNAEAFRVEWTSTHEE